MSQVVVMLRRCRMVSDLLAALEEARDTLRDTEDLAGVLTLEAQIQVLSRRLGFDDGGSDAR